MTFTKNVKNELMQIRETSQSGKKSLLSGFVYLMKEKEGYLSFSSENEQIFLFLKRLLQGYEYEILGKEIRIFDSKLFNTALPVGTDKEAGLVLRGIFIGGGVISDPQKSYHLEINGLDEVKCGELLVYIKERGINIGQSVRKGKYILYIKDSETISDFLTYIGAVHHSMEVMNAKILKEVRNNVNRTVNCEAANIEKTAKAASRQIADIEYILEACGEMFLSPELRQIAELRLENVDMSLKAIGEACEPKISRSGVNHRLEKISSIAENLRKSNTKGSK